MGTREICEQIVNDGKEKALQMIDEGKKTALQKIEEAKQRAKEENKEILELELKRIREEEKREIEIIDMMDEKEMLKFREESIEKIFEEVEKRFLSMHENMDEYDTFMRRILEKGRAEMGIFSKKHMNRRDIHVYGDDSTSEMNIAGGIIFESDDGKKELRMDLETILRDNRAEMLKKIEEMLFGGA